MSHKLALSKIGVLYHDRERQWVWNDPLRQRTFHITAEAIALITSAHGKTIADALGEVGTDREKAAQLLTAIERNILVVEGSNESQLEQTISEAWDEYGRIGLAYHYNSRTKTDSPFDPGSADPTALTEKASVVPPPPPFTQIAGLDYFRLPDVIDSGLPRADLLETLQARRTSRDFHAKGLTLQELSALLQICARPTLRDGQAETILHPLNSYYKVVPSGGGRHPTEFYLNILRVHDVAPGAYHYHPGEHSLARIGSPLSDSELAYASGGQEWVARAAVQIVYVSQTDRNRWKYQMSRAYRALNLDVGHISQAVFLVATAMKLEVAFIGSFRDEPWESLFDISHWNQLVLGMTILDGNGLSEERIDNA